MDDRRIVFRDVRKSFATRVGERVDALAGVSFDVGHNEFVTIVGPSGCGKSTLLKLVAGVVPLGGGEITLDGRPVTGPRRDIGMVFQSPVLLRWRNVLDNVLFPDTCRPPRFSVPARGPPAAPGMCTSAIPFSSTERRGRISVPGRA